MVGVCREGKLGRNELGFKRAFNHAIFYTTVRETVDKEEVALSSVYLTEMVILAAV